VPTSKRPQINNVQYPRIPSKILKGTPHEEVVDDVAVEVAVSGSTMKLTKQYLILNVWSVETPRYLA
jgi:hypothetical protein